MIARRPHSFLAELLVVVSGPLVWFFHFNFIYALAGFGGAVGFSPAGVLLFAWVATLAAVAALVMMLRRVQTSSSSRDRDIDRAMREISRALAGLSLVGVLFEALVLWFVPL
jgi:hypothetical protein